jgi:hypothetical protein
MAEHTFLFREGLWRAEGEFFDATGARAGVEGEAQIRHYPDKWIYEGTLRTVAPKPVEHRTVYEIHPFVPGNLTTLWTSKSASLGTLQGRFIVLADAILASYESATGRFRGQDTILRRDERHYSARGALFDGAKLASTWAVELNLSP